MVPILKTTDEIRKRRLENPAYSHITKTMATLNANPAERRYKNRIGRAMKSAVEPKTGLEDKEECL